MYEMEPCIQKQFKTTEGISTMRSKGLLGNCNMKEHILLFILMSHLCWIHMTQQRSYEWLIVKGRI